MPPLCGRLRASVADAATKVVLRFDKSSALGRDLHAEAAAKPNFKPEVELEFRFSDRYPLLPPFVRIARPPIAGGFVIDGALCMELLTPSGWSPANSIEGVIVQVRRACGFMGLALTRGWAVCAL